jgi:hypothetical protein
MGQLASLHLFDRSPIISAPDSYLVRRVGLQVLKIQLHLGGRALRPAENNHDAIFTLRPVPLRCRPGIRVQTVRYERVEITIKIRPHFLVLTYRLLYPGDPLRVVDAALAGIGTVPGTIAEPH